MDDTAYSRLKCASTKLDKKRRYGNLAIHKQKRLWKFIDFVLTGRVAKEPTGNCDPRCPATCRWRDGKKCRKYRAYSNGDRLLKQVNFDKCREREIEAMERYAQTAI